MQTRSKRGCCVRCRGEPIPWLHYAPEEVAVWGIVLRELRDLYPKHACEVRCCLCSTSVLKDAMQHLLRAVNGVAGVSARLPAVQFP